VTERTCSRPLERPRGILIFFHCRVNSGYAIRSLEEVLLNVGENLTGPDSVYFAYRALDDSPPAFLPSKLHDRVFQFDPSGRDAHEERRIAACIAARRIDVAIGFDQPVGLPGHRTLRRAGVKAFVAYWGAPMSGVSRGIRLLAKRLQVILTPHRPDHFIFESEAMRETAVRGRGIARRHTSVCYLGVDPDRFRPSQPGDDYAHRAFGIPCDRRIVYYAGHFEPRKGVGVIMQAARQLVEVRGRRDVHFLLLGNRGNDAEQYRSMIRGTPASDHVTFGGYRHDVEHIVRGCYTATIASTGWDSFTMSAVETAASGVPLVASRLQGLAETLVEGVTGYLFPPGDHSALAHRLELLLDDRALRDRMSVASRERIVREFTRSRQVERLSETVWQVWHTCVRRRPCRTRGAT
jgi:glycosyltransferase involved in cell wall biosynthesis